MACIDHQEAFAQPNHNDFLQTVWAKFSAYINALLENRALHRQQKIDRKAFMNLVGKEEWLYKDIGIHEGDVAWASTLPLDINAAKELEKIRLQNRKNL